MRLFMTTLPTIENLMTYIVQDNGTVVFASEPERGEKFDQTIAVQIPILFDRSPTSLIQVLKGVKLMSECFGGCRLWLEIGIWINPEGDLIWNLNLWIKSSMTQTNFERHRGKVEWFACQMRDELQQKCVVVEFNNQLNFF